LSSIPTGHHAAMGDEFVERHFIRGNRSSFAAFGAFLIRSTPIGLGALRCGSFRTKSTALGFLLIEILFSFFLVLALLLLISFFYSSIAALIAKFVEGIGLVTFTHDRGLLFYNRSLGKNERICLFVDSLIC